MEPPELEAVADHATALQQNHRWDGPGIGRVEGREAAVGKTMDKSRDYQPPRQMDLEIGEGMATFAIVSGATKARGA